MARTAAAQNVILTPPDETLAASVEAAASSLSPPEDATPADVVALANGDYQRVVAVLYDAGYFGPSVSIQVAGREAAGLSPLQPPSDVGTITIRVDTGPKFRFGRAQVLPLPDGVAPTDGFGEGEDAGLSVIRTAASNGVRTWREASHAKAAIVDQTISVRHRDNRLDAVIRIEPGPPLRFGELSVSEDSAVRPERIRAIAGLPTGEDFSPEALRRVRERLVSTGTFRSVRVIEADVPNPDGTLDMAIDVADGPPRRLGFGAELSSNQGLSLEAFWMHRNIFGGAENLRFDLGIDGIGGEDGGADYGLATTLTIPGYRRPDDTLTLSFILASVDEPTYQLDALSLGARRDRRFSDTFSAGLGARVQRVDATTAFGNFTYDHVILEANTVFDLRDDPLAPTRGAYADLKAEPMIGFAGSASGLRLTGDTRSYVSLGENTVLAGRLQAGSVLGTTIAETPPDLLFLSGGGGTVRGQDFQSLGVETPNGRIGGRSFLGLSAEIRQSLGGALGVVAFADMGFVSEDNDFSDLEDHAGFGLGARYRTGVGSLRFDVAFPVDDPELGDFQLYIGLGEAF